MPLLSMTSPGVLLAAIGLPFLGKITALFAASVLVAYLCYRVRICSKCTDIVYCLPPIVIWGKPLGNLYKVM
jgi:hypothetical protein